MKALTCEQVEYDDDTLEWVFRFGTTASLRVAAPWRIVAHGRIELGCDDHRRKFGHPEPVDAVAMALALLGGRTVESFSVSPVSGDAIIDLAHGTRLEIFNSSSGYEAWVLAETNGRTFVAQGGGRLVEYPPSATSGPLRER
jgi:hypothetical protein